MIKFEHTEVVGWQAAIRGMRNPLESWEKSDSVFCDQIEGCSNCPLHRDDGFCGADYVSDKTSGTYSIGKNDHDLMMRLRDAGTDHRKFMRMIVCYVDITAPLYWRKEMDTYRMGVEKNSCSTMHCIQKHEFTLGDFSHEHMTPCGEAALRTSIERLNMARGYYNKKVDKPSECMNWRDYWWDLIQLLPSSYNQKRTYMISYEALANMYHARKEHKLDEWREGFCNWVKSLPYSELITG